ncbi:hypothetical protein [Nitrospina watsonii]|uniref:Uncharacterized protein n=1 Tax=Nitrospina watsonii TaxID=1323948 RepID=A0ABM9HC27_9BACT|nr:hypothetical protein [Nitrospina watsonii]CAI2717740.1 conserved protein of unknown function [Nitrospina watsonii]
MIGAIEILIILVIIGIIYSKDVVDKTWRKRPDEGVVESFAVDVKDYYKTNPKRLVFAIIGSVSAFIFVVTLFYWLWTRTDFKQMLGLE